MLSISVSPSNPSAGDQVCVTVSGSGGSVSVSIDGGPAQVFRPQNETSAESWTFCFNVPAGAVIALISASQGPSYQEQHLIF